MNKYDVFISYSHKDSEWVCDWLLPRLESAGIRACIDSRDFEVGVPSLINMERAVEQSEKVIFVLTKNWINSEWTNFEQILVQTEDPIGLKNRILPIKLEECEPPKRIAIFTYANFTKKENWLNEFQKILRSFGISSPVKIESSREPYFVHPFPLQENFTGRIDERKMLTEWIAKDTQPVLAYVAIGGMGKSSVACVWTCKDLAEHQVPGLPEDPPEILPLLGVPKEKRPEGILWYSFYEGGGNFRDFLGKAISYCSNGAKTAEDYIKESPSGPTTNYGKMQEDLLPLLKQNNFLFIWDGAERLLREYERMDAEMREEREPEELEPEARDFVDPATRRFLQEMASQSCSRILLTSRLYPRDLENLSGVREVKLTGLGRENAVAFLRALGIRGNRAELESVSEQYEFHPLSLSMLVADLRNDFELEGDIKGAVRHDETEKVKARHYHIMERAYNRRAPHRQELLSRMAAMRGAIPRDVIHLLAEDIAGLELETLGKDLSELVRHGLLRHPSLDKYDFHPLVRRYSYIRLQEKETIHRRLMEYYQAIRPPDKVTKIEDLTPTIELYHHTVRAGLYDEACDLFRDRLMNPLYFQFGAYQIFIELMRALFPDGEDHLPRLKEESAQAWTLAALGNSYGLSGEPRNAAQTFKQAVGLAEKLKANNNVAIGLANLAYMAQMALGELKVAEHNLRRSIELFVDIPNEFGEAVGHQELGRLLAYEGDFSESKEELEIALKSFGKLRYTQSEGIVWSYRTLRALLIGETEAALGATYQTLRFWEKDAQEDYPVERDRVRCEWLLGWSKTALASEKPKQKVKLLEEAEDHLTEALTRCRRINVVDHEPDILLAWARWHRLKGNEKEAKGHAEEALSIADRCEYRLKQADIHNFLAQLALDDGDRDNAKKHAEIAKERAECDWPEHYYKPAYEEAERLLTEAGK